MKYTNILSGVNQTPQSKQARPDQIPNNAGGYAFAIDKWQQLTRFLVLGTSAGTYYVHAQDLTLQNLDNIKACLKEDGPRVVKLAMDISDAGRAIKNDPAILVMAAAISYGDEATKRLVQTNIHKVCRIGTHILTYAAYADQLRRWGRALRTSIANWFESFDKVDSLAYQCVKYQSRNGWSMHDLIRLSHVGSNEPQHKALYDWALHGYKDEIDYPNIVEGFEKAKTAKPGELAALISAHNLSREMVPTDKLNEPAVARVLAQNMPMTAMIRNLGNLSKAQLLNPGDEVFKRVVERLGDLEEIKKARVHPISLLIAEKTYASGRGVRGHGEWPVTPQIIDALDKAFYLAFQTVEPTNKNLLLAIDVSGSMTSEVTDTPGFSALQASVAMALVTANTEPSYTCWMFDTGVAEWPISPRQRLDDILARAPNGGGTDVSAPIRAATQHRKKFDAIIVYTDSETWFGSSHPFQAMAVYRQQVNPQAKLIVVAATATNLTVAAPDDPLSLTICGFDPTVPEVIRQFVM